MTTTTNVSQAVAYYHFHTDPDFGGYTVAIGRADSPLHSDHVLAHGVHYNSLGKAWRAYPEIQEWEEAKAAPMPERCPKDIES